MDGIAGRTSGRSNGWTTNGIVGRARNVGEGRATNKSDGRAPSGSERGTTMAAAGLAAILLYAGACLPPSAALAGVSAAGDVTPADPASWTGTTNPFIGYSGIGHLTVDDGSGIVSKDVRLGYLSGSEGTVLVAGAGSAWTNSGQVYVGLSGSGTLTIEGGGQVSNYFGYVGFGSGSQSTVNVTGEESTWTNTGQLSVGSYGFGTLTIEAGGQVKSTVYAYLGSEPGSQGIVTVSGTGSTWINSGFLYVGYSGGGALIIEGGGVVRNYIGYVSGPQGAATVTGTGSQWTNSAELYVSGALTVEAGGQVSNAGGYARRGTVTVTGSGSAWANSGALSLGDVSGAAVELTISGGGEVSNTYGYLGNASRSQGTARVTGDGSAWRNSRSLVVGASGTGALTITDGGQVSNTNGILGDWYDSQGTVTVAGGKSAWTNSEVLYVGNNGAGVVTIVDGGQVSSTGSVVGRYPGSQGTATVTGGGSKWTSSGNLYVGYTGTGSLTIADGGAVTVGSTLTIGALGRVTLDGGTIDAPTITATTGGATDFRAGTLCFGTYQGDLANPGCTVGSRDGAHGMTVTGGYVQGGNGTLLIEIAGLPESGQYDVLTVGGSADLAGTLEVRFLPGLLLPLGTTYEFLKAGGIAGTFGAYEVIGLAPGLTLEVDIPAGSLTVVPEPAAMGLLALGGLAVLRRRRGRGRRD